jgi:SMC interacting uncharacterized protein involved in chromosome segregation
MTDLINALREKADGKKNVVGDYWGDHICREAAAEIERLEKEVERWQRRSGNAERIMEQRHIATERIQGEFPRLKNEKEALLKSLEAMVTQFGYDVVHPQGLVHDEHAAIQSAMALIAGHRDGRKR